MKNQNQKMDFLKITNYFFNKRIVCFTLDIDWAQEAMIEKTLEIFKTAQVPVTIFLTHYSKAIEKRYNTNKKRLHVGLHPNFMVKDKYKDVIETCLKFWPKARSFRSHAFFDNSLVTREFTDRNFLYDSNLGLFLQPKCVPLRHHSGLVRFPVFWEDDIHLDRFPNPPRLAQIKKELEGPGLKIFNFHPFHIALNTPSLKYYEAHRFLNQKGSNFSEFAYKGQGIENFLEELINYFKEKRTIFWYLDDLYLDIIQSSKKTKQ